MKLRGHSRKFAAGRAEYSIESVSILVLSYQNAESAVLGYRSYLSQDAAGYSFESALGGLLQLFCFWLVWAVFF